jgi:hypothetical protein
MRYSVANYNPWFKPSFAIWIFSTHFEIRLSFQMRFATIFYFPKPKFINLFFWGKQRDFTQHKRKQSSKFSKHHCALWIDSNSCELIMPTRLRVYVRHQEKGTLLVKLSIKHKYFASKKKKKKSNFFLHSLKLSVKSPSLSPPMACLFQWYPQQSKEIFY